MPGSTDQVLLSKIIETGEVQVVLDAGIKPHHLSEDWADVLEWIFIYFRDHGAAPTKRALEVQFGDVALVDGVQDPFPALFEEVYAHYQHKGLLSTLRAAYSALDHQEPYTDIIGRINAGLQGLTFETARLRDVDVISTLKEDVEEYEKLRHQTNVLRGIPTGYFGLDGVTGGFRPQQLITFAGEPKAGKSLYTLVMAMAVHRHGKRPFYVSFEMSAAEVRQRFHALATGISYSRVVSADLSPDDMEKLQRMERGFKNMHSFMISEDAAATSTVAALDGKVRQHRPDVLFVDGVYLMDDEQGEPKGSPQALTNITRALKRLAQRHDIPVVITTQVLTWKLGNKTSRAVTGDAIGYSSSFVQDSDLVMAVEKDPDSDNRILRVVMARAAPQTQLYVRWDWRRMDFSEISMRPEDDRFDGDDDTL